MAKLDTADDLLAYLVAHPDRVSLTAFDVAASEQGIYHRAEVVLPIGSVFKVAVLYAVAREVVCGTLSLDEPVPLDALEAFRLPGSGVDVHQATRGFLEAQGVSFEEGAIALRHVVQAMITLSDNEATDYLIVRLGQAAMEAIPAQWRVEAWEPPVPVSGTMAMWCGPQSGPRPRDWTTRCLRKNREQFRDAAHQWAATLRKDPEARTRVAAGVGALSDS